MPTHLASHSYYSLLAGIPAPAELAAAAAAAGQPALALVDHNRLSGAIEFTEACREHGIKPILCMEVNLEPSSIATDEVSLVLLAMDASGWASLCKLSSWLQSDEHGEDRKLLASELRRNTNGLICLAHGADKRVLASLKNQFGDRLYLQLREPDNALTLLAKSLDIKTVAFWPIYYLHKEQADLQRTLTAMRLNTPRDKAPESALAPENAYFPSNDEFLARFETNPDPGASAQHPKRSAR